MNFLRAMMALPQPVKGCLLAYMIVFGVAFVSIPVTAFIGRGQGNSVVPWTMTALGISAAVLGLVLATDLRGSARAYASLLKDFKPMGIDYSNSMFAKPGFIRFFGAMFALVGIWFVVVSAFFASSFS